MTFCLDSVMSSWNFITKPAPTVEQANPMQKQNTHKTHTSFSYIVFLFFVIVIAIEANAFKWWCCVFVDVNSNMFTFYLHFNRITHETHAIFRLNTQKFSYNKNVLFCNGWDIWFNAKKTRPVVDCNSTLRGVVCNVQIELAGGL